MVLLKDIAKACGVSTAAVSKALHHAPDISEETRKRICETASAMGYLPNASARALKTKRTYNLGVVFKEKAGRGLTHEYFGAVLDSFKKEAERAGYDITFINNERKERTYLKHCIYRSFDGAAVVCADFGSGEIKELLQSELPVVTVDDCCGRPAVISDNEGGMRRLTDYICARGHRRIAYIHGEDSEVTQARLRGFAIAVREHGIRLPQEYICGGVYHDSESGGRLTAKLLAQRERPTCILYPDDFSALGGILEIRRQGLRIPEDISVAGFDGTSLAEALSPKLTTVVQDTGRIGRETARALIRLVEGPEAENGLAPTVVETVLREGASVGAIRKNDPVK